MPTIIRQPGKPTLMQFAIRKGENMGDLPPVVNGRIVSAYETMDNGVVDAEGRQSAPPAPFLLSAAVVFDVPGEAPFPFEHVNRYLKDANVSRYNYSRAGSEKFLTFICTSALPVSTREDKTSGRPFGGAVDVFFNLNAVLARAIEILQDTEQAVFKAIIFRWLKSNIITIKTTDAETGVETETTVMPKRDTPSPRSNSLLIEGLVGIETFKNLAKNLFDSDDLEKVGFSTIPNIIDGMPPAYAFDPRPLRALAERETDEKIYKDVADVGRNMQVLVNKFRQSIVYVQPNMTLTVRREAPQAGMETAPTAPAAPAPVTLTVGAPAPAQAAAPAAELARKPRVDPDAVKRQAEKERKELSKAAERAMQTDEERAAEEKEKRESQYAAAAAKDSRALAGRVNRAAKRDKPEQFAPFFDLLPAQQKQVLDNLDDDSSAALSEAYAPCESGGLKTRLDKISAHGGDVKHRYLVRRCAPEKKGDDPKYDVIDRAAKVIHANVFNSLVGALAVQALAESSGKAPLPDDLLETLGIVTELGAHPELKESRDGLKGHRELLQKAWPRLAENVRAIVLKTWKEIKKSLEL